MQDIARPSNTNQANQNPKPIEQGVGRIFFQCSTPSKHNRVNGVKGPNKHKRTFRAHPTYQAETENTHQDTYHLDRFYVRQNKPIDCRKPHISPLIRDKNTRADSSTHPQNDPIAL